MLYLITSKSQEEGNEHAKMYTKALKYCTDIKSMHRNKIKEYECLSHIRNKELKLK